MTTFSVHHATIVSRDPSLLSRHYVASRMSAPRLPGSSGHYPSFRVRVSDRPGHAGLVSGESRASGRKEQDKEHRGRLILVHGRLPDVWDAHDRLR